jgi:hypothetical protein
MKCSVPLILDYYEFDKIQHNQYFVNKKETFKLKCKFCSKSISAAIDITSNWVSHIKTIHLEQFNEYEQKKKKTVVSKCLTFY